MYPYLRDLPMKQRTRATTATMTNMPTPIPALKIPPITSHPVSKLAEKNNATKSIAFDCVRIMTINLEIKE